MNNVKFTKTNIDKVKNSVEEIEVSLSGNRYSKVHIKGKIKQEGKTFEYEYDECGLEDLGLLITKYIDKGYKPHGTVNALKVDIYNNGGDYSNNGISSRYKSVFIPCASGNDEINLENPPENFVLLDVNDTFCEYKYCKPYKDVVEGNWVMMGGTFVYSSDGRFSRNINQYQIALHDRKE